MNILCSYFQNYAELGGWAPLKSQLEGCAPAPLFYTTGIAHSVTKKSLKNRLLRPEQNYKKAWASLWNKSWKMMLAKTRTELQESLSFIVKQIVKDDAWTHSSFNIASVKNKRLCVGMISQLWSQLRAPLPDYHSDWTHWFAVITQRATCFPESLFTTSHVYTKQRKTVGFSVAEIKNVIIKTW